MSGHSKRPGPIHEYLVQHSVRSTKELDGLQQVTLATQERRGMLSPPDSVAIHQMFVRLTKAKNVIEVGVFTGFTTLGFALALPDHGKVVACDISDEYASVGKPYWDAAGVAHKIDLRIAPAADTLTALLEAGGEGTYDLGFIDADKSNYDLYYELLLRLLRPGGVILVDNVLWGGKVLEPAAEDDADTRAIQDLNKKLYQDERIDICMLSNSDGITVAYKR